MPSVFPSIQQPLPGGWAFEIPIEDEIRSEELDQRTKLRNNVLNNIHELVNVDAPDWYINPDFKTILGNKHKLEALADGLAIAIPLQIGDMLYYATKTVKFKDFKTLPKPKRRHGECTLCATKRLGQDRVCILEAE